MLKILHKVIEIRSALIANKSYLNEKVFIVSTTWVTQCKPFLCVITSPNWPEKPVSLLPWGTRETQMRRSDMQINWGVSSTIRRASFFSEGYLTFVEKLIGGICNVNDAIYLCPQNNCFHRIALLLFSNCGLWRTTKISTKLSSYQFEYMVIRKVSQERKDKLRERMIRFLNSTYLWEIRLFSFSYTFSQLKTHLTKPISNLQ